LFNIAGAAFDRLAAPYGPPLSSIVDALFQSALAAQPPEDLRQIIEERRATQQRRSSVTADALAQEKAIRAGRSHVACRRRAHQRVPIKAAELYRGVVAARAQSGLSAGLVLARLNLAIPKTLEQRVGQRAVGCAGLTLRFGRCGLGPAVFGW
uniref:hypothetical protein n=1 Tax=Methylibium sp. TaxID=2067992 RepID=UPI0025DF14D1